MIQLTTLMATTTKASVSTYNSALGHLDRWAFRFAAGAERFDEEFDQRR